MSSFKSPSRVYDINGNFRPMSNQQYFNFDPAFINATNSHKSSSIGSNNESQIKNDPNFNKIHHENSQQYNNSEDDVTDHFYDCPTHPHDNAHNTSGYSSGFDDSSYASSSGNNSTLHETSLDHTSDRDDHHLHPHHTETTHEVEYSRAPDTFPCGHTLCHNCVRKFIRMRQRSGYSCCPVCHTPIYDDDISLQSIGLAVNTPSTTSTPSPSPCPSPSPGSSSSPYWSAPASPTPFPTSPAVFGPPAPSPSPSDPTPISLLTNFDEMIKKFTGFEAGYYGLRKLKNESVKSKSMGMTYTNTQCHLCMENHGTLRVVQEYNQLSVKHERPNLWSNYFYRLQNGKVVTEFHTKVNSSCICVPCTYRELQARNLPQLKALPNVDPNKNTEICLAEVGKILAKNSAPIMALQGKNVIEIEHTLQLKQRADQFDFLDTAGQVERLVKQQEEMLLNIASRQIRDTGRLYHIQESNAVEYDLDETSV